MVSPLSAEFYAPFRSNAAKECKPSPSLKACSPTDPDVKIATELDGPALAEGPQYGPIADRILPRSLSEGWRVSIASRSQDVTCKALNTNMNPGDSLLVRSPVYALLNLLEVKTVPQGLSSESLRSVVENWNADKPKHNAL
ncbi:hypothetical protein PsYK624_060560 [Phanerochaete sordida]|uniref:Uncharacterized protein n=1 Tax=Phanerochaete sordida TaxID=48140 RepID=A0A9P3G8C9_9APHY|nr:hypothetical protein PsYK624_060560 [Phanerochaete sordida]